MTKLINRLLLAIVITIKRFLVWLLTLCLKPFSVGKAAKSGKEFYDGESSSVYAGGQNDSLELECSEESKELNSSIVPIDSPDGIREYIQKLSEVASGDSYDKLISKYMGLSSDGSAYRFLIRGNYTFTKGELSKVTESSRVSKKISTKWVREASLEIPHTDYVKFFEEFTVAVAMAGYVTIQDLARSHGDFIDMGIKQMVPYFIDKTTRDNSEAAVVSIVTTLNLPVGGSEQVPPSVKTIVIGSYKEQTYTTVMNIHFSPRKLHMGRM